MRAVVVAVMQTPETAAVAEAVVRAPWF